MPVRKARKIPGALNKRNAAAVICALTLLTAALAQPSNDPYSKNPKLESVLSQLISSDNPQGFAMAHNIFIKDGKVRVVVELGDETAMLPDYVMEETRHDKNVQILVPLEKIAGLSQDTNVTYIRTPLKPYADNPKSAIQTSTPKSGSNSTILIIVSIILIFLIRKKRSDSIVNK